jgi:hypothetical protein
MVQGVRPTFGCGSAALWEGQSIDTLLSIFFIRHMGLLPHLDVMAAPFSDYSPPPQPLRTVN